MKTRSIRLFLTLILVMFFTNISLESRPNLTNCQYKGKKLYGRIEFVETFPDVRVRIVKTNPHLRVQKFKSNTKKCGEWEIVKFPPSIRVMLDEKHGEIDIQYVTFAPGVPK